MNGKIKLWPLDTDLLRRCISLHRFFLAVCPLVILILLSNANPAASLAPDWSTVRDEPFSLSSAPGIINPVLTASDVTDVSAQFVADPFLFRVNDRWYLFFEVLNNDTGLGQIGLAVSNDGLHWDYDRIVLTESIHLSYPYVFEYQGEYYMMPETAKLQEIRLYKARNFPYEWQYFTTLVKGKGYVDSSIFRYNGTWWLFSGGSWRSANMGHCFLFYSDNLLSGWTEHPQSPVVVNDPSRSRPGGRAFVFDTDRVVRIVQKDDVIYGQRVRAFVVDRLTKTEYREHEIPQSPILYEGGTGWRATGMHHFSPWWTGSQWIAAVDGQNNGIWSIGMYVANSDCLVGPRFVQNSLAVGMEYYTDRDYMLTAVPSVYLGLEAITTPNEEREWTEASGYLKFEMPFDGTVYVAYDSRATGLPAWMSGFVYTGYNIETSLATQPYLKVYSKAFAASACVNLGANKAAGFAGDIVSNYIVFYDRDPASACVLDSSFSQTTLEMGMNYYTDRDYQLTAVPSAYLGMETITTPNEERDLATPTTGYLTFEMPFDGTVYVAYDSRATGLPNWLKSFTNTGDIIETSLSTQPYLKVYSKPFAAQTCVNLGANKAAGFTGDIVSNYIVFYGKGGGAQDDCTLNSQFEESIIKATAYYYTDRNYTITGGLPDWMIGRTLIQTPNDERFDESASGYVRFKNSVDWWVYVLFDSRASSIPNWLKGWEIRGEKITTSLSSQPYLKVYRKQFAAGQCVDLGGNYGPGSSGEIRSNFAVVYGK